MIGAGPGPHPAPSSGPVPACFPYDQEGALRRYGTGQKPVYDMRRV